MSRQQFRAVTTDHDDDDWRTDEQKPDDNSNRKATIAANLDKKLQRGAVANPVLTKPAPQASFAEYAHGGGRYAPASGPLPTGPDAFGGVFQPHHAVSAAPFSYEASAISADLDPEAHGWIHQSDLASVSNKAGESAPSVIEKLTRLGLFVSGDVVTLEALLAAVSELCRDKGISATASKGKIVLHGSTSENTTHIINEDEKQSFVEHINQVLASDRDLGARLPIDSMTMQIFAEVKDGLILAKLINDSVPNTIDERVLNVSKK
ncbi:hypothetical protein HK100_005041 [Physocladia obscura]|uniref:Uncharacterized protein n=1 Tax=Physocladia obscura TaxID=109957 RepID=A0AAD5T9S9_9FUNG|nr:hypothetical protein HK100_005041 [Physocladia obscura]